MRLTHFEALTPLCPNCRRAGASHALVLARIEEEQDEDVRSGILQCEGCGSEYPILDGLPVIVPDLRRYIQDSLFYLLARSDLSGDVEGLLGDAAGPGTGLDAIRQHTSSYAWDHWGDRDPRRAEDVCPGNAAPGSIAGLTEAGLSLAGDLAQGPILDVGCGGGRSLATLAERTGRMSLGIDVSVPLARFSRRAVVDGLVAYGLRRIGLVYEPRRFEPKLDPQVSALCDVWICDVLALPFTDQRFAMTAGFNVVDCLADPVGGLREIDRVTRDGGSAMIATPFDWSAAVTPVEAWLGGHSGRGLHKGSGAEVLDLILSDGPQAVGGLRRRKPALDIEWHVRLHDRSCMTYLARLVLAEKARALSEDAQSRPGELVE